MMPGIIALFCVVLTLRLNLTRSEIGYPRDIPSNPLHYPPASVGNDYDSDYYNPEHLTEIIPGIPGVDYPIYPVAPQTSFRCADQPYFGYYADTEAYCQGFHICQFGDNRQDTFLCPNGTLFNQEFLVCDWWYHVDCSRARDFYFVNEYIQKAMEEASQQLLFQNAERVRQIAYNYRNPVLDVENAQNIHGHQLPSNRRYTAPQAY